MLSDMFTAVKAGNIVELERLIGEGVDVSQPDTAPKVSLDAHDRHAHTITPLHV